VRTPWRLIAATGIGGVFIFGTMAAQQPAAQPAAGPDTTPPPNPSVYQPDTLAGEKNFVIGVQAAFTWGPLPEPKPIVPEGFTAIFNGQNLAGWHVSRTNHHGTTPDYHVLDGAIVGTQSPFGSGGILLTDKSYRNFELYMEVRPDYGCDSGIFFRSTEAGHAYQITMDYLPGGSMGSLITESITNPNRAAGAGPAAGAARGAAGSAAAAAGGRANAPRVVGGIPLGSAEPMGVAAWMKVWKREAWNTVRARVEGDIPHVQVWINDVLVTDTHETTNRAEGGMVAGPIAIQIHGGNRWVQAGFWRWRNIGIKELP
jgi:hypothetical protein